MGCATQGEKAVIVQELRKEGYELKYLLVAIGLARSTYCFEISKADKVDPRNEELKDEITAIFQQNKGRYGVRRVFQELVKRVRKVNHKRVQRPMHVMQLKGKRPKE